MTTPTIGVKYIGSKHALLSDILQFIEERHPEKGRLIDVFAGTTRVGQAFRTKGWTVQSSDLSWAAESYAHAFLLRTSESGNRIPTLIEELRATEPKAGWLTAAYCETTAAIDPSVRIQMWTRANGKRADAMRDAIAIWESTGKISHHEAMILIACLIIALDKVDSSVGVQQAYLKSWATRALSPLELRDLPFPVGPVGAHYVGDCRAIPYTEADVAYVDPPYSAHSYATYYHIWDSVTRWDKPAVGLKTNRRADRVSGSATYDESMSSPWNSKRTALAAFIELVTRLPVKAVVISYNDESLVPLADLEKALRDRWPATVVQRIAYRRNIMCQIGNAAKSSATSTKSDAKTENTEVLIWVPKV
jgi:adenine-specific DNA-methyltransferase